MPRPFSRRRRAPDEAPVEAEPARQPVHPLAIWPSPPPENYLGQLHDHFQANMAAERAGLTAADCRFYHSVDLPDGESHPGAWDLRGHESEYYGGYDFKGKRVLELGPSTGHLTFWMEREGAEVVCIDAGFDVAIDLHPHPLRETRELRLQHFRDLMEYQWSWWYLRRRYGSAAKMVYAPIYSLPGDLGEFDVSVFGAILLHLRSPVAALEEAARRTRSTIVVTDVWSGGEDTLHENIMRPFPVGEGGRWVVWWELSAGAVVQMLKIIGFGDVTVTTHTQKHQYGHHAEAAYNDAPMYTVVAHRTTWP